MELNTVFAVLQYLFMGIFIIFFVMDIASEKPYKTYYYIAITIAVTFTILLRDWSIVFKVGFIALFVLLTVKTIFDERIRVADINANA